MNLKYLKPQNFRVKNVQSKKISGEELPIATFDRPIRHMPNWEIENRHTWLADSPHVASGERIAHPWFIASACSHRRSFYSAGLILASGCLKRQSVYRVNLHIASACSYRRPVYNVGLSIALVPICLWRNFISSRPVNGMVVITYHAKQPPNKKFC